MTASRISPGSSKLEAPELANSGPDKLDALTSLNPYITSPVLHPLQEFDRTDHNRTINPSARNSEQAPDRSDQDLTLPGPQIKPDRRMFEQSRRFSRKPSQRPALSRKIKCDKTVPCGPCSKRGCHSICRQEPWIPSSSVHAGESVQAIDGGIVKTLNELKHEVSRLQQQVKDLDGIQYRLRELEDLMCKSHYDRQEPGKTPNLPSGSSPSDRFLGRPTVSPIATCTNLKKSVTPRSQDIPSEHNSANYIASPTTSAVSERMRIGLVDNHDTPEDAATAFEFLALAGEHQATETTETGRRGSRLTSFSPFKNSSANLNAASNMEKNHKDSLLTIIPPDALSKLKSSGLSLTKSQSDAIIDFALDTLGWQHPVIHFTTFRAQANAYWNNIQESSAVEKSGGNANVVIVNQAWFALYISLLSVGVHHMSAKDAEKCKLNEEDLRAMPGLWFKDCIASLNRFNYLENPCMETLQAITVLGCSGYDIGPPKVLCVLHACANRIAQILGIDRISPDPAGPVTNHEAQKRVEGGDSERKWSAIELMEREVGKRVWWALVTQDWFWVPHHKSWCALNFLIFLKLVTLSISPGHFSTPIPSNWPDDEFPQMNFSGRPMRDDGISMVMQQVS
ncbi:hypothetical protein CROQUDRAFT_35279 [Cronartium quercuum f. sp. fusiforme G11]|uniref:Uncharacterized protein n=1 Tax=Cronartium quercuum f. sp. fusiforme G11 TaxID=708437 RepID=A0A9P6TJ04_9BASI|nr:hypothetical protein CROQUDRAFT_35279 [Cronartium quercuum f. sp. fusiforme G11]